MLTKTKFYRIFIEILLCQIALIVVLGINKPSYFVDEIWTYNLANAYMFPAFANVDGYFYAWLKPDFWKTLVVVAQDKAFSYDSVWYNQSKDVLPPFFYAVVHTVSSFFPGKFSNWFVLGPNLLFFIGSQFVLLQIAKKIFQRTWFAIIICLIYGFTLGGINSVLYFRMYMMVSFFGLLAFYLHMQLCDKLAKGLEISKKIFICIALVDVLGFLTHYYYLVFISFVAIATMWWMNKKKLYSLVLQYFSFSIAALVVCIGIFPPCLKQIAGVGEYGYRGAQSLSNAFNSSFLKRLGDYNSLLAKDLGGDILLMLLLIIGLMVLNSLRKLFIDFNISHEETGYKLDVDFHSASRHYSFHFLDEDKFVGLCIIASVPYYLTIAKISVMSDDRYIFMVIPFIIIWGFYLLNRLVTAISGKKYLGAVLCVCVVWLAAITSFRTENIKFADMELPGAIALVEEKHKDTPMLVINSNAHWHPIIEHIFLLEKTPKAYLTTENEIEKVKDALSQVDYQGNELLAFVTWECKKPLKDIQEELKQETGFKHCKVVYEGGKYKRGHMYVLTK